MAYQRKGMALSSYRDQQFQGSMKEQEDKLRASSTLYVGNLSFYTSEDQIYHLFDMAGDVKKVTMGLDRHAKTPCGFCFVEFYTREDAEDAMRYITGTRLDDRIIRCDWDAGFIEGRQYGRGRSGGQVRDEFRMDYDAGRGGFGKMVQNRMGNEGAPGGPRRQGKRRHHELESDNPDEQITDLRQKLNRKHSQDAANGENGGNFDEKVDVNNENEKRESPNREENNSQAETKTDETHEAEASNADEKESDQDVENLPEETTDTANEEESKDVEMTEE